MPFTECCQHDYLLLGALARLEVQPGLLLFLRHLVHLLEALLTLEALLQLLLARFRLLIVRLLDRHPLHCSNRLQGGALGMQLCSAVSPVPYGKLFSIV